MPDRFVWIAHNGRMFPQKWPHDFPGNEKDRAVVGGPFNLRPDEFDLSLDELARRYPAPNVVGEVLQAEPPLPRAMMPKKIERE